MTKDILYAIIQKVEAVRLFTTAMINDLAPNNVNDLGISQSEISFSNLNSPLFRTTVYADVPNLIRLIRNYLIDSGFTLSRDKTASSDCLRELTGRSTNDLKVTHLLSANH